MTFPTLEEWKTPWEEKGAEIDADKAKAFVYAEKKRAYDFEQENKALKADAESAKAKVKEIEEAAEAKRRAESETEDERTRRESEERAKADAEREKALAEKDRENALLKVQIQTGLSETQVKRLQGDDFDDLIKDAEAYIEENGLGKSEEDASDDSNPLHRQPLTGRINPGDPDPLRAKELDGDDIANVARQRRNSTVLSL